MRATKNISNARNNEDVYGTFGENGKRSFSASMQSLSPLDRREWVVTRDCNGAAGGSVTGTESSVFSTYLPT